MPQTDLQRRTRLALALAAMQCRCVMRALMPEAEGRDPEVVLAAASRAQDQMRRVKHMAVVAARLLGGADWPAVAAVLRISPATAAALYEGVEDAWRAREGDDAEWFDRLAAAQGGIEYLEVRVREYRRGLVAAPCCGLSGCPCCSTASDDP